MDEAVETIDYRNHTIKIYQDIDAINPIKEFDTICKFICFHSHYDLSNCNDFDSPEEVQEYAKENNIFLFPLYLYDHSGITISVTPFNCLWDSGQVGWVMIKKKEFLKEWGGKYMTKKLKEKMWDCVKATVKGFDYYLTGAVYGYIVGNEEEEAHLDSCWGFYGYQEGSWNYMIQEAKDGIDWHIEKERKDHFKQLKIWIKNQVPMRYREPCPVF